MPAPLEKNAFFNISKLPPEKGLLLLGLSMNKLFHRQSPEKCIEDVRIFHPSKVSKPLVGCNFIYADFLYLYTDRPAAEMKDSFMHSVIDHKNGLQKILEKNNLDFQIQHAFAYMVWNQLYVGTNDFNHLLCELKRIYATDPQFQKYVADDCAAFAREMGEHQVNFFLEEILMLYLLTKNRVKLPNEYIEGNQKWILFCYPGRPLKSTVYLYQLNPFGLDWPDNPYQDAHYDLEAKQLVEFDRVDLETYTVR